MAEISLFEPMVLTGVIEKRNVPEEYTLTKRFRSQPYPLPGVLTWDIIEGDRSMARPNLPDARAHIVGQLGRRQMSARALKVRELKTFPGTVLRWVRMPGQLARTNAETVILREVEHANQRIDNFVEYCWWGVIKGELTLDYLHNPSRTIDYGMQSSHKPTVAADWSSATPIQIINDIRTWQRLIRHDSGVEANEAFVGENVMDYIYDSFAAVDAEGGNLLSDRMKEEYSNTGTLPGFMGISWKLQRSVYDDYSGSETTFFGADSVALGNFTANDPFYLLEPPTEDLHAPEGFTGRFAKTWLAEDPPGYQYLIDYHFLPVAERVEQWVYVSDVKDDTP